MKSLYDPIKIGIEMDKYRKPLSVKSIKYVYLTPPKPDVDDKAVQVNSRLNESVITDNDFHDNQDEVIRHQENIIQNLTHQLNENQQIINQNERLKKKIERLNKKNQELNNTIQRLNSEKDELISENFSLNEQVKYLRLHIKHLEKRPKLKIDKQSEYNFNQEPETNLSTENERLRQQNQSQENIIQILRSQLNETNEDFRNLNNHYRKEINENERLINENEQLQQLNRRLISRNSNLQQQINSIQIKPRPQLEIDNQPVYNFKEQPEIKLKLSEPGKINKPKREHKHHKNQLDYSESVYNFKEQPEINLTPQNFPSIEIREINNLPEDLINANINLNNELLKLRKHPNKLSINKPSIYEFNQQPNKLSINKPSTYEFNQQPNKLSRTTQQPIYLTSENLIELHQQEINQLNETHQQEINQLNETHQQQISQLNEAYEEAQQQISQLNQTHEEAHEQQLHELNETHEQQLHELNGEITRLNGEITTLNETHQQQINELEEEKEEIIRNATERISELETELERQQQANQQQPNQQQIDDLNETHQQQINELNGEITRLNGEKEEIINTTHERIHELEQQLQPQQALNQRNQALNQENSQLKVNIASLQAINQNLETSRNRITQNKSGEILGLNSEIQRLRTENVSRGIQITARDNKIREKEDSINSLINENSRLRQQVENLNREIENLNQEKTRLQQLPAEMRADFNAEASRLRTRISGLEEANSRTTTERDNARSQVTEKDNLIKQLRSDLESANSKISLFEETEEYRIDRIKNLKEQQELEANTLQKLHQQEIDVKNEQLTSLIADFDVLKDAYDKLKESTLRINDLNNKMKEADENRKKEIDKLKNDLKAANSRVERDRIEMLMLKGDVYQQFKDKFKRYYTEHNYTNAYYQKQITNLRIELDLERQKNENYENLKQQLTTVSNEKEGLISTVHHLEELLNARNSEQLKAELPASTQEKITSIKESIIKPINGMATLANLLSNFFSNHEEHHPFINALTEFIRNPSSALTPLVEVIKNNYLIPDGVVPWKPTGVVEYKPHELVEVIQSRKNLLSNLMSGLTAFRQEHPIYSQVIMGVTSLIFHPSTTSIISSVTSIIRSLI